MIGKSFQETPSMCREFDPNPDQYDTKIVHINVFTKKPEIEILSYEEAKKYYLKIEGRNCRIAY